jgi:hypothetical protein
LDLRLGRGDTGLLRIALGAQSAVVKQSQELPAFYMVAKLRGNVDDAAIALGCDVGLLLGDQRAGGGKRPGVG